MATNSKTKPDQTAAPFQRDFAGRTRGFEGASHALWVSAGPDSPFRQSIGRVLAQPRYLVTGETACTAYGEVVTNSIVADLRHSTEVTPVVVTGGQFGIDAAALRAALTGGAIPVAVLASGIDRIYPEGNRSLLLAVAEHGALLASRPPPMRLEPPAIVDAQPAAITPPAVPPVPQQLIPHPDFALTLREARTQLSRSLFCEAPRTVRRKQRGVLERVPLRRRTSQRQGR
ncbi:MAG: DNA-protecting protein DprA [Bifidobacteriaceae bacterium]|jgi:hypothetical protein|nr:DNA-protecting protein DprA [Bifidobacteriaceae bacterium]